MRPYLWDQTLTEPSIVRVRRFIMETANKVNARADLPVVGIEGIDDFWLRLTDDMSGLDGHNYQWAEGVPAATFVRQELTVGVVGVAWWIAPDRTLFVRIVGERIENHTIGYTRLLARPWGLTTRELLLAKEPCFIWPRLYVQRPPDHSEDLWSRLRRAVAENPLSREDWGVYGDYCEDQGDEQGRAQAHDAVTQLNLLREYGV